MFVLNPDAIKIGVVFLPTGLFGFLIIIIIIAIIIICIDSTSVWFIRTCFSAFWSITSDSTHLVAAPWHGILNDFTSLLLTPSFGDPSRREEQNWIFIRLYMHAIWMSNAKWISDGIFNANDVCPVKEDTRNVYVRIARAIISQTYGFGISIKSCWIICPADDRERQS